MGIVGVWVGKPKGLAERGFHFAVAVAVGGEDSRTVYRTLLGRFSTTLISIPNSFKFFASTVDMNRFPVVALLPRTL